MVALKTILVVDDNQINRKILVKMLSSDYQVMEAENGQAALDILRAHKESISVVILDIIMPVMDGYEVLDQMRKDPYLSQIPVIVASGQDSEDAEIKALSLGANDYIVKPYKLQIIRHRIDNTITLKETSAFVNSVQHDALTGLFSKEYFYIQVAQALKNNPDIKYDLICLDIERFKLVNDRYGTAMGNELLKHISDMLRVKLQGYGFCARLEADEFACLIPHHNKYNNSDFLDFIEEVNAFSDAIKLNIILRYGIYSIDDPLLPVEIMCDRAALAKASIKGKYDTVFAYYDDSLRQKLIDEELIVSSMKSALEEHQFQVYYQPKYDLRTEQISGAEALVRWQHPVKGFLSPAQFIPIFEKNGSITQLDYYVWEETCKTLKSWKDAGAPMIPLSVNVSRVDIYDPQLPDRLLNLIQKYELPPKYLHLEITESAYMENPQLLIDMMANLKKLGFVIEMDDFGTGYSSLNMLSELPIDILKLDMRFIQKEEQKSGDRSVLSFIISLAKWMNLKVVAEGTETIHQTKMLQSLGCEYAQGYYFAKPMPLDHLNQLLQDSKLTVVDYGMCMPSDSIYGEGAQRKTLLVLDPLSLDIPCLSQIFETEYVVIGTKDIAGTLAVLDEKREGISALAISLPSEFSAQQVAPLLEACSTYCIPTLLVYDQQQEPSAEFLGLSIADYTARPVNAHQFSLRLTNAIANAKLEKFQQEREVNAAIIEMRRRAEHDALTGLLNRAENEVRMEHFFFKNPSPQGIYMVLDVDNFKSVNDTYGHIAGDKVLQAVAKHLVQAFPETEVIARIGGDEFSVFIPYPLSFSQLHEKLTSLCSPFKLGIENLEISCTVGMCYCPEHGNNQHELYTHADIALLEAKRQGKQRYLIYNPDMNQHCKVSLGLQSMQMLDNVSDAMFVCDATNSKILYINGTACDLLGKERSECLDMHCYELFWNRKTNCDRCADIGMFQKDFYEETTVLADQKTPVHIKARLENWQGKPVKVHYLQVGIPDVTSGNQ